jgi:hypothetical protein
LKGKKHIKAAKELKKAMRAEDFALGVSDGVSTAGTATPNLKHNGDSHDVDETDEEEDVHQDFVYLDEIVDEEEPVDSKEKSTEDVAEKTLVDGAEEELPSDKPDETLEKQTPPKPVPTDDESSASDSEALLEKELDALLLGSHKDRTQPSSQETKPKIGAAKAKRQKKAEKLAALESEGKAPQNRKQRKAYDPVAAMQKARGETVTTGRKGKKK